MKNSQARTGHQRGMGGRYSHKTAGVFTQDNWCIHTSGTRNARKGVGRAGSCYCSQRNRMAASGKRARKLPCDYGYVAVGEEDSDGMRVYQNPATGKSARLLSTPQRPLTTSEHAARLKPMVEQVSRLRRRLAQPPPPPPLPRCSAVTLPSQRTSAAMASALFAGANPAPMPGVSTPAVPSNEVRLLTPSTPPQGPAPVMIVTSDLIDPDSGLPRSPSADEVLLMFDLAVGSLYQQVAYAGDGRMYRVTSTKCLQHASMDNDLGRAELEVGLAAGTLIEIEFLVFQGPAAATALLAGYTRIMARGALVANEVGGVASVRVVTGVNPNVGSKMGARWRAHAPASGAARVMERRAECGETITAHVSGNMAVVPHYGSDLEGLPSLLTLPEAEEAPGRISFVYYLQAGGEDFLVARMDRDEGGFQCRRRQILDSARPGKKERAEVLLAEQARAPAAGSRSRTRAVVRSAGPPANTLDLDVSLTVAQQLRFTPAMAEGGWYHTSEAAAHEMIRANFALTERPPSASAETAAFVPERLDFALDVDKLRRTAAAQWAEVCKMEAAKTNTVRRASSDHVAAIRRITRALDAPPALPPTPDSSPDHRFTITGA